MGTFASGIASDMYQNGKRRITIVCGFLVLNIVFMLAFTSVCLLCAHVFFLQKSVYCLPSPHPFLGGGSLCATSHASFLGGRGAMAPTTLKNYFEEGRETKGRCQRHIPPIWEGICVAYSKV